MSRLKGGVFLPIIETMTPGSSTVACIRLRGNTFTQLFHSNGCTCNISYFDNSSIVACGHYLATALSLPPQFLLCENTPHYTKNNTNIMVMRTSEMAVRLNII
jgi:hypothetical protein